MIKLYKTLSKYHNKGYCIMAEEHDGDLYYYTYTGYDDKICLGALLNRNGVIIEKVYVD